MKNKPSKSEIRISQRTWNVIPVADQLALLKAAGQTTVGPFRLWHELPQQTVDALLRVDWYKVFAAQGS